MAQLFTPPFTEVTARTTVQQVEDAWNTRQPGLVANAYSHDSNWRIGEQSVSGREAIRSFLAGKWKKELHYRLNLELWTFNSERISVHLICEWQNCATGQWFRTQGNESWSFDTDGLIRRRDMSATDIPISAAERQLVPVTNQHARMINA